MGEMEMLIRYRKLFEVGVFVIGVWEGNESSLEKSEFKINMCFFCKLDYEFDNCFRFVRLFFFEKR